MVLFRDSIHLCGVPKTRYNRYIMVNIQVVVREVLPQNPETFRRGVSQTCRDVKGFTVTAGSLDEARDKARAVLETTWILRSISFAPVPRTDQVRLVATVKAKG